MNKRPFLMMLFSRAFIAVFTFSYPIFLLFIAKDGVVSVTVSDVVLAIAVFNLVAIFVSLGLNLEYFSSRYVEGVDFHGVAALACLISLLVGFFGFPSLGLLNLEIVSGCIISIVLLKADLFRCKGNVRAFCVVSVLGYFCVYSVKMTLLLVGLSLQSVYLVMVCILLLLIISSVGKVFTGLSAKSRWYLRRNFVVIAVNFFGVLLFWSASQMDRVVAKQLEEPVSELYSSLLVSTSAASVFLFTIPVFFGSYVRRYKNGEIFMHIFRETRLPICLAFIGALILALAQFWLLSSFDLIETEFRYSNLVLIFLVVCLNLFLVKFRILFLALNFISASRLRFFLILAIAPVWSFCLLIGAKIDSLLFAFVFALLIFMAIYYGFIFGFLRRHLNFPGI